MRGGGLIDLRMRGAAATGRLILLVCLLAFDPASARGQANSGDLGGVVRDLSGAVLPGATVVATHVDTGFSVQRITDAVRLRACA